MRGIIDPQGEPFAYLLGNTVYTLDDEPTGTLEGNFIVDLSGNRIWRLEGHGIYSLDDNEVIGYLSAEKRDEL